MKTPEDLKKIIDIDAIAASVTSDDEDFKDLDNITLSPSEEDELVTYEHQEKSTCCCRFR